MPKNKKKRKARKDVTEVGQTSKIENTGQIPSEETSSENKLTPLATVLLEDDVSHQNLSGTTTQSQQFLDKEKLEHYYETEIECSSTSQTEPLLLEVGSKNFEEADSKEFEENSKITELREKFNVSSNICTAVTPMAKKQPKGILGKKIGLIANYLPLNYKHINIFHYDIEIEDYQEPNEGEQTKSSSKKGKSIIKQERTVKEDIKAGITHIEHEVKRKPGKEKCRKIMWLLFKNHDDLKPYVYAYDGQKNLYTNAKLPLKLKDNNSDKRTVNYNERDRIKRYVVIIKEAVKRYEGGNKITLESVLNLYSNYTEDLRQESVMILDTIMCHRKPQVRGDDIIFPQIQLGRSFFELNSIPYTLGQGVALRFGYNQSVHLTEKGPALVVNLATKPFILEGTIMNFASNVLNIRDFKQVPYLKPFQIKKLSNALSKVKVIATHLPYPRKYTVERLTNTSVRDTYQVINGNKISVENYFKEKHKRIKLVFANLPCLKMISPNMKETYLPMEVCKIAPNQPKMGTLSSDTSRKMIQKTAIIPEERFNKIYDNANLITSDIISGDSMQEFGLSLSLEFMELDGRVLEIPKLSYKKLNQYPPIAIPDDCGRWKINNNHFIKSNHSNISWVLISFADEQYCSINTLQSFGETLCKRARNLGMSMGRYESIKIWKSHCTTQRVLKEMKELKVDLVVIVLEEINKFSEEKDSRYEEIKSMGDPEFKLCTQCLKCETVVDSVNGLTYKPYLAYQKFDNILNKINIKLGGINHKLNQPPETFKKPFIVFGADVTNSPRGFNCPSIASVVGSLDLYAARYAATSRVQYPENTGLSQEIILELDSMIEDLIDAFKKTNVNFFQSKQQLEKILFLRDGVSEGQFRQVLEKELPLIQRAFKKKLGYIPSITLIIVQKRHQTRIMPQHNEDGIGRGKNVPPGTVVDHSIVHPTYFDFFLCSHEGIQGTSKPAHYTVLHDENKFSSDELQKLCYYLCYLYVRCNRSISIPAPIKYADLCCTRAKIYVDNYLKQQKKATCPRFSDEKIQLPQEILNKVKEIKNNIEMCYI